MTAIMLERFPLYRLPIQGVQKTAARFSRRVPPTFEYRMRLTFHPVQRRAHRCHSTRVLSWFQKVSVLTGFRASALVIAFAIVGVEPPARADRATARALVEEGQRLLAAGSSDAGLNRFERAMSDDPDYLPAYDAATSLWLHGGQHQVLIDRLAQVTLRHPRYAAGWYALAVAYRRTERHALAVLCYETYLELRPGDPDPYFGAAMSHLALGDRARAARSFERYLELERRAERTEFVDRARLELQRLREEETAAAPVRFLGRVEERIRAFARAARALL
jgi:tetratricopeptide (TPR) repeat protein